MGAATPVGRIVPLVHVEPDPAQPRRRFGSLAELTASVRARGLLEPILARRIDAPGDEDPRYRIIAGERRFRAAQAAGLTEVPVIEMNVTRREALEIALVENLQRMDLTPFEEAEGLQALVEEHDYTHDQIAAVIGRSRVSVTESLALLRLPAKVRAAATSRGVSDRKSVLLELLKLSDEDEMIELVERIADLGLKRAAVRAEVRERRRRADGRQARRAGAGAASTTTSVRRNREPHVFRFRAGDERWSVSLSFWQEIVEESDLIGAFEEILIRLKRNRDAGLN